MTNSLFSRNVEISSASVAYNMSHKVDDNGEIVDSELEREHWTGDGRVPAMIGRGDTC